MLGFDISLCCMHYRALCSVVHLHVQRFCRYFSLSYLAFCFSKWYSSEALWAQKPQAQPLGLPSKEYISTRVCCKLCVVSCYSEVRQQPSKQQTVYVGEDDASRIVARVQVVLSSTIVTAQRATCTT